MPPPAFPASIVSQPLGAAAPLGKVVPPSSKPASLSSRPSPAPVPGPTLNLSTNQPTTGSNSGSTTPLTPISSTSATQPVALPYTSASVSAPLVATAPVIRPAEQAPAPILVSPAAPNASQNAPSVAPMDTPSTDQPQGWVEQAEEWIRIVNLLVHEMKKRDVTRQLLARYEARPDPSPKILDEITNERAIVTMCEANIRMYTQQFARCLASMHASASSASGVANTLSVTSGAPAFAELDPEVAAKILALEDQVSQIRSELVKFDSTIATSTGLAKDDTKGNDIQSVKDGIRQEAESRAKDIGTIKSDTAVTKSEVGTLKMDVEGMKMEVAKAYKGLGESKTEVGKLKVQQDMLRATMERIEQELADVQKERGDTSVEVQRQFKSLKREIEQLKTKLNANEMEPGQVQDVDQERKKAAKREREPSAPSGDGMDVDEAPPVKRVRLNLTAAGTEPTEVFPPEMAEYIGGPSNEQLKELIDKLQDHIALLEGEIGENHIEISEQVRELQHYVGLESVFHAEGAEAEPAGRSGSAPPAASSQNAAAAGVRSSAPPEVSLELAASTRPVLKAVSKDKSAVSQQIETFVTLRRDTDRVMEQLLAMHSAQGLWPDIVARNLVASGTDSLTQLWDTMAKANETRTGIAAGSKQANGDSPLGMQDKDTIKSLQTELAELKASRIKEAAELKATIADLRKEHAETKTELQELRSIIEEALTPGNSTNPLARIAQTDSTSVVPEILALRELASIMPILLKMAGKSGQH
ncbi:cingulin [Ceratobasidium sp. AG-Ba]|nr:cingulin [Ceratobasidium sp. AG-Ba]QRW01569.1 cingulin [Ceratobasidium sp. AG-Ba]